ncbi:MAG: sigma-70 family RNA polymerase sigma factor [Candidatus Bipolaricaulia bacterium]
MMQTEEWRSGMPSGSDGIGSLISDLYTKERMALVRYAGSLARNPSRAEDLVQDAFVRAMSNLDLLAGLTRGQRRAWLYRVIKNRYIDQTRRGQRWGSIRKELERAASRVGDPVMADVRLWELLDSVPDSYSEVLRDRYVLGMTSAEIGERLGIPAATVRSRLRLAAAWMRKHRARLLGKE